MDFLSQNWFFIVALILFVAMHLFGFGCGHEGRGHGHSHYDAAKRAAGTRRGPNPEDDHV